METSLNVVIYSALFLGLYFEIFLVYTYVEKKGRFALPPRGKPALDAYPSTTIIVPAWNEERTLSTTIESLLALDYPKERLNIMIIDDGSSDDTLRVARRFLSSSSPHVSVFTKENGGKHTALNFALARIDTELIGCLDADSSVSPDALTAIIPHFDDPEVMAVTPSVQVRSPKGVLERMQAAEYMLGQFTRKIFSLLDGLYVTPGPFSIYRRSVFERIGGFAEGYQTEDMEMALRMQSHRFRIENAHGALVLTAPPKTLLALYRQRVRWVSGFLKNVCFRYRHMILNRRYGNLGLFTLPFALVSIVVALFFSGLYVKNIFLILDHQFAKVAALGFDALGRLPSFDWFFINLTPSRLIMYLLLATTVTLLFMGKRMVTRRLTPSVDMLYFIFLYGLVAPFWLVRSLYNLASAKEARWR